MKSYEIKNEIDRIFSENDGESATFKTIPNRAAKKLGGVLALTARVVLEAIIEGAVEGVKRKITK